MVSSSAAVFQAVNAKLNEPTIAIAVFSSAIRELNCDSIYFELLIQYIRGRKLVVETTNHSGHFGSKE